MNDEKTVGELWDKFHTSEEKHYISDNPLKTILDLSNINEEFEDAKTVIEIGVGTARCSKEIVNQGKELHCVDISTLALSKVARIAQWSYLSEYMNHIPKNYFDLVIEFLVAPHISDEELNRHLKYVIPSLKEKGTFSLQITFNRDPDLNNQNIQNPITLISGLSCRTPEYVTSMIEANGGEVTWVSDPNYHDTLNLGWHTMKIRRV